MKAKICQPNGPPKGCITGRDQPKPQHGKGGGHESSGGPCGTAEGSLHYGGQPSHFQVCGCGIFVNFPRLDFPSQGGPGIGPAKAEKRQYAVVSAAVVAIMSWDVCVGGAPWKECLSTSFQVLVLQVNDIGLQEVRLDGKFRRSF